MADAQPTSNAPAVTPGALPPEVAYELTAFCLKSEGALDLLQRLPQLTCSLGDTREACVALLNPDHRELQLEGRSGTLAQTLPLHLPLAQGLPTQVALSGESQISTPEDTPAFVQAASLHELLVPLIADNGDTFGLIWLARDTAFARETIATLEALAQLTSAVLAQLWEKDILQARSMQLEALLHTGRSLVAQHALPELLQLITQRTRRLMSCRLTAILLLDDAGQTLELKALHGSPKTQPFPVERVELGDSAIGTALKRQKMIEIGDLRQSEEHHFVGLAQHLKLVSVLACPIIDREQPLGVLNVYTDSFHRFSNDEKRLLNTMAGLSAMAIQNVRLYERTLHSEETLRRNERLTTLGLVAAEIAHEIRNPLTVLRLLFDALDLDFSEGDPRQRDLTIIREKMDQLEGIVNRVLHFGKARQGLRSRYVLQHLIRDSILLVRLKAEQANITLDYQTSEPEPIWVEVHKGQIQQVVLNLIFNALQATPSGGTIRLRSRWVEQGGQACAEVDCQDTGSGIPEAFHDKIFDPLLSGQQGGSGLGLGIVKRILKAHMGDIELVETGPGGTRFRFWLPLAR